MKKMTKNYAASAKLVEKDKLYDAKEALEIIEKMPKAKFDEDALHKGAAIYAYEAMRWLEEHK